VTLINRPLAAVAFWQNLTLNEIRQELWRLALLCVLSSRSTLSMMQTMTGQLHTCSACRSKSRRHELLSQYQTWAQSKSLTNTCCKIFDHMPDNDAKKQQMTKVSKIQHWQWRQHDTVIRQEKSVVHFYTESASQKRQQQQPFNDRLSQKKHSPASQKRSKIKTSNWFSST